MASNLKNISKSRMMSGDMDLNLDDMRLFFCMTNTTFDTDVDTDNTGSYTLDEFDGSGTARYALANEAVAVDDANDRAEFDADDVVTAAFGNGTRQIQGAGIHEFITNDAGSFPLCWVEFAATINPGGSTITIAWSAEGIVQLASVRPQSCPERFSPMSELKIIHDAAREVASRGMKAWTFTIDGQESLYWCQTEAAVNRVVSRLQAGRSGEAFGGAGVVTPGMVTAITRGHDKPPRGKIVAVGEVTTETVTTKSGREKPREKRPGFIFELDGKTPQEIAAAIETLEKEHDAKLSAIYKSEYDAKVACAIAAFKSRGKLNRFAEAEAAFKDKTGKTCKVQLVGRKIVAKDQDGGLWAVGLQEGKSPIFKLVVPAPPK